jgi:hypothetical protein
MPNERFVTAGAVRQCKQDHDVVATQSGELLTAFLELEALLL